MSDDFAREFSWSRIGLEYNVSSRLAPFHLLLKIERMRQRYVAELRLGNRYMQGLVSEKCCAVLDILEHIDPHAKGTYDSVFEAREAKAKLCIALSLDVRWCPR